MNNAELLLNDEEFNKKLDCAETDEEIISLFADHGVTVTKADLAAFDACDESADGEISEESLDQVSGGALAWIVRELLKKRKNRPHHGGGGRLF